MRILYVLGQFPKLSESFVINELYELDRLGHDILVFSLKRPEETVTHSELDDLEMSVYYGKQPSLSLLPGLFSKELANTRVLRQALFVETPLRHAYWLHLGKQIAEVIEKEGGVDIVHTHFANPNKIGVSYAAAYHQIPCTVTAHANEIFSPSSMRRLQRVCSRFNHVIVPSEYNRQYLRNQVDVESEISVVPATTSVNKFEASDGCVSGRLLTVARLVEKKGYEYAIDAVAELIEQGYDIDYHIVGIGGRKQSLRRRVQEHGIEERVHFLGHVSDDQLINELHEAAVFVLPCVVASDGDRDVAPVALKEAMATQTACVSTTISAIPELITDGEDGILVEPNDTAAVVEAVAELLDDPQHRRRLAENGRTTVQKKFDISRAVSQLEDVFESTMKAENNRTKKKM